MILLSGLSDLVSLLDVASKTDAIDPGNKHKRKENTHPFKVWEDFFLELSFGFLFVQAIETLFCVVLNIILERKHGGIDTNCWSKLNDTDNEKRHIETSLVKAGAHEGTEWVEEQVQHDEQACHI